MSGAGKGKYSKLDLSPAEEVDKEVLLDLTSGEVKDSLTDPSMDIDSTKLTNHESPDQSYDTYDQARPSGTHFDPDQRSAHDTATLTSGHSLSELPFRDLWRQAKRSIKSSWRKSTLGTARWCRQTKDWILSRYFVTWLLLYFVVGPVILTASLLRYNALSGVYLLCLLVLPLMPNPSRRSMAGRTGLYLIVLLILAVLACLTQAIFQIVLAADSPYGQDWVSCNGTEPLWRQLGYQRLNDLSGASVCRLILPDVVVLIVTIIVLVVCKKLFTPPPPTQETQESSAGASGSGEVQEIRSKPKSVVVEGLQSFLAMLLCAFAAVIFPSAISGFYFITFLIVITWWSFYRSWGRRFYHVCIVWLLYCGAHIFALYLAQFQFFQEAFDDDFYPRLFGLRAIIDATDCAEPRTITLEGGQRWWVYVNPGALLIFYFYLAILIRCWLDGPDREVVRRQKRQRKQHGEKERLMDESGPSYQSMDPTDASTTSGGKPGGEGEVLQRQASATGEEEAEDGQQKMSPFATLVAYVTKQCYIAALILMMVWSITYHSWLTFVLLLWSILIWIIPISTTRNRALYSSPLLVFYCMGLLLIQFVYGLDLKKELPDEINGINLTEIGLMKFTDSCFPLALQLLYTVMLWLTLRQFLREKRLSRMNVNSEGIILQPFGMIFSDPDQEMLAIEEARKGGDFTDKGDSETMSVIGNTILGILSKYWIFLVAAMFLIVGIQQSVDVFKIVYLGLFLIIANMFLWSFTLFRGLIWIFLWLVVVYSIAVLVLIYTYQFKEFPGYWANGTGLSKEVFDELGLEQYKVSELFLNLLAPTAFIIIIMVYLHYFHSQFMDITKIQQSGYKPSKIKEEDDEEGAAQEGGGDEVDRASQASKKGKTHSKMKLYVKYLAIICKTHCDRVAAIIWRVLEIHMSKIVIFTIVMVVTREMTAANGVLVLLILVIFPLPWFTRCMFLVSALWVSAVIFVKMVFQLKLIPMDKFEYNCTGNSSVVQNPTYLDWFGLRQTDAFPAYIIGYVFIILMMILWYIAQLRQEHYRNVNNLERPKQRIIFEEVKREQADEGLLNCIKFFANYCFYKYGLEICYITTVIVSAIRLDVLSFIYMVLMLCMIFLRRRTVSFIWPFYTIILLILLPLTYALALGLPPVLCIQYPWAVPTLPQELITWLYLSDYLQPPVGHFIVADFFQLLFVCLQLHVFRIEKNRGTAYGGGDNYEAYVDVENIAENPVPNFTFSRSYLDAAKTLVFEYLFWVTLAVAFLAGTTRVSLFGLIYIIFSFYFLWLGSEYLIKPTGVVIKRWNKLLFYNLFVIFLKVCLQIMSCVYIDQLLSKNCCWLLQLLGVVCLQADYEPGTHVGDDCTLPLDEAGLSWDVAVFIFLLIQKRIYTSNYFQYIVVSLEEQKSLASKGAELINELLATRVRNKRLEEKRILEGIKKKMARIQKQQKALTTKAEWTEPKYHDEAVRGQGGYYMFKDFSEEELSDLEPDAIPGGEGEEGKHSAFHLVHDAVAMSPEDALKKDDQAKDEDVDAGETSGAADADKKEDEDKKDGPLDIEEAEDVLAEIEELEKEDGEEEKAGICNKILNVLKLVWRVLMRGLEGCIQFFDEISEEYRYVAHELDKLSTEGKRQRALKKKAKAIKPAGEGEGSGGAADIEEIEPHEPTKVSIKVDDAENAGGSSQGDDTDALAKAETASTAETTSSEKFVRTMPRPVRFFYSLLYAIISQSQLVCYFLIILNLLLSANLLSLLLPILVFTWAMLSVPRPTKRFWITVITYTELVVILKYFFQFYFYPWNTEDDITLNAANPLWWPVILGINRKDAYAVLDLCILLAAFFHRSILRRHGLWQESQVVPNLEDPNAQEPLAITDGDTSVDDVDSKKKKKKKKKKSKDKGEKETVKTEAATAEAEDPPGDEGAATSKDGGKAKTSEDAEGDSEADEKEKRGIFAPFVDFYHNMLDPTYTAVTDVYVPMFLCDVFNFILFAIFSYSFGEEQAQSDVTELITSNSIPLFFVLLLLLQFVLMVIDRAIYLRKGVVAKFIFLIIVIVGVHVYMFFLLPKINNRRFTENVPAQIWYFVKCIYFGLSAYQIRCGYPTRILGNCLCKRYNYINLFLFYGYQAIPFLKEIRMLMDWMFTDTTLSMAHWVEIEDVYSNVYTTKCWRNAERKYPVDRGLLKSKVVKYGAGGIQLLFLLVIVWFPLLLISLSNTSSIANPPSEIDISISISGYGTLFESTALDSDLHPLSQEEYDALVNDYGGDLNALTFLKNYRAEDIVKVTITGESTSSWDVSPPSRQRLEDTLLNSKADVDFRYSYAVKRTSDSSLVTPIVDGYHQIGLSHTKTPGRQVRDGLANQLMNETSTPVTIPKIYPGFLRVPAKGNAEPATKLLNSPNADGFSSMSMMLQSGSVPDVGGVREWWVVNKDKEAMVIYTLNDRVASDLFAPLAGYGVIGLYVSLVLVIGRFVRMMFSGTSTKIMFNELPNVDRIVKLCLDIFLVRECGEMELEEDLTAKLIFLYRSPAMLIEFTRYKRD